jgi:hypothetical protein
MSTADTAPLTVSVTFSPDDGTKLRQQATARGQDVAEFVRHIVKREIETRASFDAILAPLREQVEASGLGDTELDALFRQAREEVWQEKRAKQRGPMTPRAVFDCMIFLQGAVRRTSPAADCLRQVDAGAVEACLKRCGPR